MKIKISVGNVSLTATLADNERARRIYDALPLDEPYTVWGDEIYFSIPVFLDLEEGREIMEIGELGYWFSGNAFCVFYGRTSVSTDERPRAASVVSPFGKIDGDATLLRQVRADRIRVEKL